MLRIDPGTGMVVGGGLGLRAAIVAIVVGLGAAGLMAFLDECADEPLIAGAAEASAPLPVELRDPLPAARPPREAQPPLRDFAVHRCDRARE
jgi:hypothetical protein